jgi:predicted dehydrogenase
MRDIRWGIIGCGDVTEIKSGPAFQRVPHSHLVAVMRRDAEKARDYARRHDVPRWYDSAAALVADPEVDAVYVATPPSAHEECAALAARAGKPVLVEKPMARTHAECLRMVAVCESARVPLYVAYYRRSLPAYLRVKSLIDEGAIGKVLCVSVRLIQPCNAADRVPDALPWRVNPIESGGGYFVDLASHQLDFFDFLFGPVVSVCGTAANRAGLYPAEDTVSADFVFASGVCGSGLWCFVADGSAQQDQLLFIGARGTIECSTFAKTPVILKTPSGRQEFADPYPPHIHAPFVATVVQALRGEGDCPSTGTTGARTSWVIDQILAGYRQEHLTSSDPR